MRAYVLTKWPSPWPSPKGEGDDFPRRFAAHLLPRPLGTPS